jgi:hypothetical protein
MAADTMLLKPVMLISESSSLSSLVKATRPNRAFKELRRREWTEVGRPQVTEYKEATLTNWMSLLIWSIIDRVSKHHPKMKPAEIVHELKLKDPVLFTKLAPQTLGAWID